MIIKGEDLYADLDGRYANVGEDETITGTWTFASNVLPDETGTRSLGSYTLRWKGYFTRFVADDIAWLEGGAYVRSKFGPTNACDLGFESGVDPYGMPFRNLWLYGKIQLGTLTSDPTAAELNEGHFWYRSDLDLLSYSPDGTTARRIPYGDDTYNLYADTIAEITAGAGITIDGVLCKDNTIKVIGTDATAISVGDATTEGGDIVVYKDALGTVGFKVDADLGRVFVDRIDEMTSGAGVRLGPKIGVNTAPIQKALATLWKIFSVTGWVEGVRVTVINNVANTTGGPIALNFTSKARQGATETIYEARGLYGAAWAETNGNITNILGGTMWINVPSGYTPTITNAQGLRIGKSQLRDAIVTDYYGIYVFEPAINLGSISRAYGLFIENYDVGDINWAALFAGDVQICSDKKLIFEGSSTVKGDTYIVFNSTKNRIEFYLNGVLEGWIDTTGFVSA